VTNHGTVEVCHAEDPDSHVRRRLAGQTSWNNAQTAPPTATQLSEPSTIHVARIRANVPFALPSSNSCVRVDGGGNEGTGNDGAGNDPAPVAAPDRSLTGRADLKCWDG